jgi:hypothetical protein
MVSKGRTPNVDFFSGYPGLSQEIQGFLILLLDGRPFIQHVYSSTLASLIGIYLYSHFKKINHWLMLLFLFFGYTQTFLVNPTPNPGHLFQLFAIVVILNVMSQGRSEAIRYAIIGICLALSLMSKQYGLVLVLCITEYFFILNLKSEFRRKGISILLLFNIFLISIYYLSVRKDANSDFNFNLSALMLVIPVLYLGFELIRGDNKVIPNFTFSTFIPIFFILTILICYVWIYSIRNPLPILQELFIYAPREINKNVVAVAFSLSSVSRAFLGLLLLFTLCRVNLFLSTNGVFKKQIVLLSLTVILLLCFRFMGNLSGTPFLFFAFTLLFTLSKEMNPGERENVQVMMFCITPLFFILIPYPNISFHIFIIILFFAYILDNTNQRRSLEREGMLRDIPVILTSLVLLAGYLVHENQWIRSLPNYQVYDILIESESDAWNYSIETASQSESIKCTDFGCWYLRLATNASESLMNTYRKPIWVDKKNS